MTWRGTQNNIYVFEKTFVTLLKKNFRYLLTCLRRNIIVSQVIFTNNQAVNDIINLSIRILTLNKFILKNKTQLCISILAIVSVARSQFLQPVPQTQPLSIIQTARNKSTSKALIKSLSHTTLKIITKTLKKNITKIELHEIKTNIYISLFCYAYPVVLIVTVSLFPARDTDK